MADISKITLPSGTTYNFKDDKARSDIQSIQSGLAGGVKLIGTTTTELTDGATTNPIVINNKSVTAVAGNLVRYDQSEFLFDGTSWAFMGDLSSLGDLAYKDQATGTFTPSGTIGSLYFRGTPGYSQVTVAAPGAGTGNPNYTPSGTVSKPTFTGSTSNFTGVFTPEGSVAAPTISVKTAGSTATVKNPTSVTVAKTVTVAAPGATAPSNNLTYYDVTDETLRLYQIGYTTGASITTSNVTVKTGDASYEATAPAFTGTEGNVSVSGTPNGAVSQPTFSGSGAVFQILHTPQGTIDPPEFTGTEGTVTVS